MCTVRWKRDKLIFLNAPRLFFQLLMVSMTPLKKSSRKRTIRKKLLRTHVRTYVTKLLMCSVFSTTVITINPWTISAKAETVAATPRGMSYTTEFGKNHLSRRYSGNNYYGYRETPPPGYYGNWGFAPGGNYWDRNYLWRRSLGFWDTNSPACPFRSC
jgi:hypothetical protein